MYCYRKGKISNVRCCKMYVFHNLLQQIIQIISTVTHTDKSVKDLKEISRKVQIVLRFSFHVEKLFLK